MGLRLYFAINMLSVPLITSLVIGTFDPGPIDPGIPVSNFEQNNLDGMSTTLNLDILIGVTAIDNQPIAAGNDCSFDFTDPESRFKKRQVSPSARCPYTRQDESASQKEPQTSPLILISSEQKQSPQAYLMRPGGEEDNVGGENIRPWGESPGSEPAGSGSPAPGPGSAGSGSPRPGPAGSEAPESEPASKAGFPANNIVNFGPCDENLVGQGRITPVCDSGNKIDTTLDKTKADPKEWDWDLRHASKAQISTYNHGDGPLTLSILI
ncbi:hypothetical protein MMC07_008997 [Pseudocyphellaria aurata]|nr:hypothetical protein [Pseudocyphellaria aurata]